MGLANNRTLYVLCIFHLLTSSFAFILGEFPSIRPVPCENRMTGESGVCTFNWSCVNVAHGVHIGSCVDRFFVGSCCKIPGNSSTYIPRQPISSSYGVAEATKENSKMESRGETAVPSQRPTTKQKVTSHYPSRNNLSNVQDSEDDIDDTGSPGPTSPDKTTTPYSPLISYLQSSQAQSSYFSRKPMLPPAFHQTEIPDKSNDLVHRNNTADSEELSTVVALHLNHQSFHETPNAATVLQENPSVEETVLWKTNSSKFNYASIPTKPKPSHDVGAAPNEGLVSYNGTASGEEIDGQHLSFVLESSDKKSTNSSHHSDQMVNNTFLSWAYSFITNWNNSTANSVQTTDNGQDSSVLPSSNSSNSIYDPFLESDFYHINKSGVPDTNINEILTSSEATVEHEKPSKVSEVLINFSQFTEIAYPWPSPKPFNAKDNVTTASTSTVGMKHNLTRVCGRSRSNMMARIVGGRKSHYLRWPWMISLRRYEGKSYKHKCGAALLNQLWAITAAHCVDGKFPNDVILRLGEYNFHRSDEFHPHIERRIYMMIIHPEFDPATYENDLALLRFYEPVRFQANIVPVCLPKFTEDLAGRTAVVTGWGRLAEAGDLPGSLHEVHMPILTNKECEEMYSQAGYPETIRDVFVCAGLMNGGLDACEGDSGGPMVVKGDRGQWTLVGLISWGMGCAAPRQPGVYTRITKFVDWIAEIITY